MRERILIALIILVLILMPLVAFAQEINIDRSLIQSWRATLNSRTRLPANRQGLDFYGDYATFATLDAGG